MVGDESSAFSCAFARVLAVAVVIKGEFPFSNNISLQSIQLSLTVLVAS